jgi:HSP90 family molecular chaperone
MGRIEPGVNLFSRKVLIQAKAKNLLPEWLRFVKGVVDSEDIPLNLSREHLQDSALIQRLNGVLTKRVLKWLDDESIKDPKKYSKFVEEFGNFLREGILQEMGNKEEIAKLLRFESSKTETGALTSLEDYIAKMGKDQNDIYYMCVPNRALAESSPYFESFKAKDSEVAVLCL